MANRKRQRGAADDEVTVFRRVSDREAGVLESQRSLATAAKRAAIVDSQGPIQTIIRQACDMSVVPDTVKRYSEMYTEMALYARAVWDRTKFKLVASDKIITEVIFLRFLWCLYLEGKEGTTFEKYRSALSFIAVRESWDTLTWLHSPVVGRMIKGLKYQSGKAVPIRRGALTLEKLQQLVEFAERQDARFMQPAFIAGYFAFLRTGEAERLVVGDVAFSRDEGLRIFISQVKQYNASAPRSLANGAWRRIPGGADAVGFFKELVGDRKPELPLLEGFKREVATALVRGAAEEFGWSEVVRWDGQYTLRHGAALDLKVSGATDDELAAAGGWTSARTPNRVYAIIGREAV